jgi:hypothetical protein
MGEGPGMRVIHYVKLFSTFHIIPVTVRKEYLLSSIVQLILINNFFISTNVALYIYKVKVQ